MENNINEHVPSIKDELEQVIKALGGFGGILIIDTPEMTKIAVSGLSYNDIKKCLCLGIYYNELEENKANDNNED